MAILVVFENGLAVMAASHHVIDRTRELDAQGSSHMVRDFYPAGLGLSRRMCHNSRTDPFGFLITNLPSSGAFLILGTLQDDDNDGLTSAYEALVSKSNPQMFDTDGDGKGDGWEVLFGNDPLSYDAASPLELPQVSSTYLRILSPDL